MFFGGMFIQILIQAAILRLSLKIIAKHEADTTYSKALMVTAGISIGQLIVAFLVAYIAPWAVLPAVVAFTSAVIMYFCWISLWKSVLVLLIYMGLQLVLTLVAALIMGVSAAAMMGLSGGGDAPPPPPQYQQADDAQREAEIQRIEQESDQPPPPAPPPAPAPAPAPVKVEPKKAVYPPMVRSHEPYHGLETCNVSISLSKGGALSNGAYQESLQGSFNKPTLSEKYLAEANKAVSQVLTLHCG